MHRYIIKRLLFLIPTVLGVTLIIYIVMNITPGNPGRMILGPNATAAEVEAMNDELGYNDPVLVRWFNYLKNIITEGDFGESYSTKLNVLDELWPRFLITLRLAILVLVLSVCIGVPLGILSAVKQNSLLDTIPTMIAFFLAAVPSFVVGILLMYVFALKLGWFPSFGLKSVKHYVLPVIAATICELSAYLRFGCLLAGMVTTEQLFSIPGVGSLIVESISTKDEPMIIGCAVMVSICFTLLMIGVDLIYAFIDPRIRAKYSKRR